MILQLYALLVGISLVLIILGLARPSESAQALIGFFFLFLLSLVILNGNLQYETGLNVSYVYDGNLSISSQQVTYSNTPFSDSNSKSIGYYMAIGSAVGFIGVIFGIKNTNWRDE